MAVLFWCLSKSVFFSFQFVCWSLLVSKTYICLPAKRIRQANLFRLTQIIRLIISFPKSHRRNGTRDEHKHLDWICEKQICSYFLKEHLISFKIALCVKTVFQSERVLNIFYMVISGIKHNFTPNVWRAIFFVVFKKNEYSLF